MAKKKIEMVKLPKISTRTLESIRKETSRFIYVHDKDGNARCERCQAEIKLPKTKHLQNDVRCPNCKKKMIISHEWRKHNDDRIDWRVLATVVNEQMLVLRYVLVFRIDAEIHQLEEVAREILDFEKDKRYLFEKRTIEGKEIWKQGTWNFFREVGMGYYYRRLCCLQGSIYNENTFIKEVRKLKDFKYFDPTEFIKSNRYYVSSRVRYVALNPLAYEMLQKAGYQELIKADFSNTQDENSVLKFNENGKSLAKKLGLTERNFKILKQNQTISFYKMLYRYPSMTDKELDLWVENKWGEREAVEYHANHLTYKQAKYISTQKLEFREYVHYIRTCEELHYPQTDYYLYPKNFRQMDDVVANDYLAHQDKIRAEKQAKNSELIHKISEGLRNLPELKKLMGGSNGLLVYVPDSAEDLIKEGRDLHNCIGTYVERVAKQKTLIFYIRQLQNPVAPFVAMEVGYNGVIHQVRYDHNVSVEDDNIIDFAKKVAEIVKKNKDKLIKAA